MPSRAVSGWTGETGRGVPRDSQTMRQPASRLPARSRSRRKTSAPASVPAERNVGSVEALTSLTLGVVMVVAALVPRSLKQVLMLGLGGGLLYRGLTGDCGFYRALGVDTAEKPPVATKG